MRFSLKKAVPRRLFFAIVAFQMLGVETLRGQKGATPGERLKQVTEQTSLDVEGFQPWHLKLDVQLFDDKGQPSEKGTVEEWWASPMLYRVVYTSPSYTVTELHNADGFYRTKGAAGGGAKLEMMLRQVVHPMPSEDELKGTLLEQETESFGKAKLECVMVGLDIRGLGKFPYGLFPMYCMEPGAATLRLSYNFGSQVVVWNKVGTFLGKDVPIEAADSENGKVLVSAKTVTLQTLALKAGDFLHGDDLVKLSDRPIRIGAGVLAGHKLGGAVPVYPVSAKQNHVSGAVVMHALVGRDGHIHKLELLSYPDASLATSALAAVQTWTYSPYVLNGEPTDVETTITVNYNFGN